MAVTVTNAGLNLIRDAMNGVANVPKITYVAIGTGTQGRQPRRRSLPPRCSESRSPATPMARRKARA